ncbi:MAG: hypothetical protein DMF69_03480 [Acidobacteria bacterium]|nr:MAG: hypothetical protein DMF69_03480 [Acidobacteriota bacterium]
MISPIDEFQLRQILSTTFPNRSVRNVQPLVGGVINTNLKIDFADNEESIVLRFYRDGADVCRKESALQDLIASKVRIPRVLYANPEGIDGSAAFVVSEFIKGITFQELKQTNNLEAIRQAAYSVGQTLASIGLFQFQKPGRLVTTPGKLEVYSTTARYFFGVSEVSTTARFEACRRGSQFCLVLGVGLTEP